MPWWGFLIFGLVTAILTGVIVYLVVRRAVGAIDRNALAASEKERVDAELEAERKKKLELERLAGELRKRLEANRAWFEKTKERIDEDLGKEYDDLARDDGALLGKLSELLGGADEPPGEPDGEGAGDEEGGEGEGRGDPTRPGGPPEDPAGPRGAGEEGGGGG
jgi:hypothetical protein